MTKQKDLLKLYLQTTGKKTHQMNNTPAQNVQNIMGYQPSNVKRYIWMPRY